MITSTSLFVLMMLPAAAVLTVSLLVALLEQEPS
jgi:hypothetical protein